MKKYFILSSVLLVIGAFFGTAELSAQVQPNAGLNKVKELAQKFDRDARLQQVQATKDKLQQANLTNTPTPPTPTAVKIVEDKLGEDKTNFNKQAVNIQVQTLPGTTLSAIKQQIADKRQLRKQ